MTRGQQTEDVSPKLSALLVEDNLVNRGCLLLRFYPWALIVN